MPPHPRHHVVREGEIAIYHTWSRCVQQAFLCGRDPLTGIDYNYRRDWIEKLLEHLAGVFAVDVGNYNVLSNHQHAILRTRPDIVTSWSDDEVAWRWKSAWPQWNGRRWEATPTDQAIEQLLADRNHLDKVRQNLASLSWFMARWKEPIAKLANAEMERSGHFYEQRFGCRELVDDAAVLTCSIYLDLNQLRAGMADALENSDCSAIQRRIQQWLQVEAAASVNEFLGKRKRRRKDLELEVAMVEDLLAGCFLAPIAPQDELLLVNDAGPSPIYLGTPGAARGTPGDDPQDDPREEDTNSTPATEAVMEEAVDESGDGAEAGVLASSMQAEPEQELASPTADEPPGAASARPSRRSDKSPATYKIHERWRQRSRRRASDRPFLFMPAERYLELAAWAAERCLGQQADASGMPPPELAKELTEWGIHADQWPAALDEFEQRFGHAVGSATHLGEFLARVAQQTLHGIRACRDVFT